MDVDADPEWLADAIERSVLVFLHGLRRGNVLSASEALSEVVAHQRPPKRAREDEGSVETTPLQVATASSKVLGLSVPALRRVGKVMAAQWLVAKTAHSLLRSRKRATIRDLYYMGAGAAFEKQTEANQAVCNLCNALALTRASLGLEASVSNWAS
jgi:hypothetical protein